MKELILLSVQDLQAGLRDRSALLWMFVLPLVFSIFLGMFMSGNQDPSKTKIGLTILDADQSALSRSLVKELEGGRLEIVIPDHDQPGPEERWIRTLKIPAGFEEKVEAGEQVKLLLKVDKDASSEATLVAKARILRGITRLIGKEIRLAESSNGDLPAFESLVRVESRFAGRSQVIPSGFSQSFPGNSIMFVMLVALSWGASSLGRERDSGMLRRIATAPLSRAEIILGKIGGRFMMAGVQVSFLVAVMAVGQSSGLLDISGNMFFVWCILVIYALCVAPLGVAFGAFFRDPDRAASLGVMTTMGLAALGGCWWPLGIVSGPLKTLAWFTPTAWTMQAVQGIISFGHSFTEILPDLGVVLLFAAGFTLMAMRSLRLED